MNTTNSLINTYLNNLTNIVGLNSFVNKLSCCHLHCELQMTLNNKFVSKGICLETKHSNSIL